MKKNLLLTSLFFLFSLTILSQSKGAAKKPPEQKGKSVIRPFKGKLMIEFMGQTAPLVDASVSLMQDGRIDSSSITRTDKYGDFEVLPKSNSGNIGLHVKPATNEVTNVVLATQEGVEIARMKRGVNGFEYKLLPADVVRLTEMEVKEDIELTLGKFNSGTKSALQVIEHISYATDEYILNTSAKTIIDNVVKVMKENSQLKLEIISHTDSKGNDQSNMSLSQKRAQSVAEYLFASGIEKSRVTYYGKGETTPRNRCKNRIDCSEKEHAYNRRTEFNFMK